MSNSLRPHELQHARLPCPSPSPGVCSHLCPLSRWCHPTISSSVALFSSCPQSFPASGSFVMSQLFTSDGQSIRASASVLLMNIQDWLPLGLTDWISLQSKELSRVFSNTTVQKHQFFGTQPSLLITWITALSNPVKLWAMPCRTTQDGWVMAESSDKMWSAGEGNGKPLQHSCLENPMNSIVLCPKVTRYFQKMIIWVSSREVDEPRACYTEWSKSEREKQM